MYPEPILISQGIESPTELAQFSGEYTSVIMLQRCTRSPFALD